MGKVIAFCGLSCDECPAFLATREDDLARLAELATQWSGEGMALQAADIRCDGCQPGGARIFSWCNECTIRQCGIKRELANCSLCQELPGDRLGNAPAGTVDKLLRMRSALGRAG